MIRIVVDTASDYTVQEAKEKNIIMIPITVTIGDIEYKESQGMNRREFFDMLEKSKVFPKTSQPSPQAFLDVFEEAKEKGDEVICILMTAALSGTYQSAVLAKSIADYDGIYLIDSKQVSVTIQIMADYALKLAEEGLEASEIVRRLEELKERVTILASFDTLEYLAKGGRISRSKAAIGNLARIKPILTLEKGEIIMVGKGLGLTRAASHMTEMVSDMGIDPGFPVYTIYSYDHGNCGRFESKLAKAGIKVEKSVEIGPTIGAHTGPETFGIVYIRK